PLLPPVAARTGTRTTEKQAVTPRRRVSCHRPTELGRPGCNVGSKRSRLLAPHRRNAGEGHHDSHALADGIRAMRARVLGPAWLSAEIVGSGCTDRGRRGVRPD